MTRPAPALVARWYARLRALGFVDVEGGRDLNRLDAWTFRGGAAPSSNAVVSLDGIGEPSYGLGDHPTALYWRIVGQRVHEVSRVTPRRRFLLLAAELGNVDAARRRCRLTHRVARRTWEKFLRSIGLQSTRKRLPHG